MKSIRDWLRARLDRRLPQHLRDARRGLCGTAEIIGSDAIRVAARARNQGVDVTLLVSDGTWHVPIANGSGVPELQLAYDEMIKFFKRQMGL